MFKHILLPTDGSKASEDAIRKGIQLAKESGAKVTGFHVTPEYHLFTYQPEMLEDTRDQFMQACKVHAATYLAVVENAAREAGVPCTVAYSSSDHPYEAIIEAAKEHHCDLIAMASHGRKGVKGVLMGSETHKVLTHSQIPVLVYR